MYTKRSFVLQITYLNDKSVQSYILILLAFSDEDESSV